MRQRVIVTLVFILGITGAGVATAGDALVVGVPYEDIGAVSDGGAVTVFYSDADGLTADGGQFWHQDSGGIAGMAEENDRFARVLASGDFNGDGAGDLAIGIPQESIGGILVAGMVQVLYAGGNGVLTSSASQMWYQGNDGLSGTPALADSFGDSLAVGDFNGDGYDDLAIGAPGEVVAAAFAGAVWVLSGSASGLTSSGHQVWSQDSSGVEGMAEANDFFGDSLITGDFNGDGFSDLAVGVTGEDVDDQIDAGLVNVIYGSSAGLSATDDQLWTNPWVVLAGADFGKSLAAGDFDGDGHDELVIGAPNMDLWGSPHAGTVTVLRGAAGGLSSTNHQTIAQGMSITGGYVADQYEQDDRFGSALEIGDFNGDGLQDLAIGVPDEDLGSVFDVGVVHVLLGSASGITAAGNQLWHQDLSTVWGDAEAYDSFGWALASGDFDRDGRDDLAVSIPLESFASLDFPGMVTVFSGGPDGLASGEEIWWQGSPALGELESMDYFGTSLAVVHTGAAMFSDDFESGDLSRWSVSVP